MKSSQKELLHFFLIAFAWMWLINITRVLAAAGYFNLPGLVSTLLGYIAVFGPGVAAFILTRLHSGVPGVKALWLSGWKINFDKKWLVPAILLMPVNGLLTLLVLHWVKVPVGWENGAPLAMIVPIGLLIWLLGAYPEEYGWRGYAMPRLLEKFSPLTASLILGLVWGIWHLPLHFIPTTTQFVIPVWQYVLLTVLLTVVYTWLYLGTGGSVLVASLFHAFGNITGAAIPYWTSNTGRWVSFLILLLPAAAIMLHWLTRKKAGVEASKG